MVQLEPGASIIYHYCIVRRDIALGAIVAQLTHAAGESARLAPELPPNTHVVVLAVANEASLLEVSARLHEHGIDHVIIREPDAPFLGAATALGIPPRDRKLLRKLLSGLPLMR